MTVVSSKEVSGNRKRYLNLVKNDKLFAKRAKNGFHLIGTTVSDNIGDDDDNDYIAKDELLAGIYEDIDNFYANK